uniref:Uncharacterized protein n=1 Tax=Arundo donax TaxID=35708 RepID=A0A0A8YSG4_ARUDO
MILVLTTPYCPDSRGQDLPRAGPAGISMSIERIGYWMHIALK